MEKAASDVKHPLTNLKNKNNRNNNNNTSPSQTNNKTKHGPFIHYSSISLLMHGLVLSSTRNLLEAKRLGERKVQVVGDPKANDMKFPETSCFNDKIIGFLKKHNIPGAGVSVLKDGKM